MERLSKAESIDLAGLYALIGGVKVLRRNATQVQIGVEPGRRLVLHDAPAESVPVLRRLDGSRPVAQVLNAHNADPLIWTGILQHLRGEGMLFDARESVGPGSAIDPGLDSERNSLVHRYGTVVARRLMRSRQDAVVVVSGSGKVASAIAGLLAASGVGHVYQQPDDARPEPVLRAGVHRDRSQPPPPSVLDPVAAVLNRGPVSAAALAARLRLASATVRTHPPAAHQPPALVMLAGLSPTPTARTAELATNQLAHLLIAVGLTTAVVGPLVLPGRSTCTGCIQRHRSSLDSGWAAVELGLRAETIIPPAVLVSAAACVAVTDAMSLLDGIALPRTVDGTVEWSAGDLSPRRRSWQPHPDCGCVRTGHPRPDQGSDHRGSPENLLEPDVI